MAKSASLKSALMIEPLASSRSSESQDKNVKDAEEVIEEPVQKEEPRSESQESKESLPLVPFLSPSGQHFCLGPEDEATDVFVFTFQLVYARDLDKVRRGRGFKMSDPH